MSSVFIIIHNNLCKLRKFTNDNHIGRNINVDLEDDLDKITADPTTSTPRIDNHLDLSQSSVWHEIHIKGYGVREIKFQH